MSDLPRVHVHMTVSDLDKSREFDRLAVLLEGLAAAAGARRAGGL